jgi:protocatechuate 3,4-dioxygenase beta subunit
VRLAKVSGIVLTSEGRPASGTMVNAVPRSADATGPIFSLGNSARTDKDGNFTISGVAPGEYLLQTRGMQVISAGEGRTMVFTVRTSDGSGPAEPEVGSVPVNVAGEDVPNVVIMTTKGATATGSVVFEGGSKPELAQGMRVLAQAYDADGPAMLASGSGSVKPDGTFELRGLSGGRIFRIGNAPSGWMLKAVRLNGQDITDTGTEFKAGEAVTGLEIVLTNKLTSVSGTVTAGNGTPVKDYTVVLFSDDDERWTAPQTRWVFGVRPDQDGKFQVRNLPAGGYYAVAVEYIEQGTWGDPELLQRLKSSASSFSLDEGQTKTLDLKMSR